MKAIVQDRYGSRKTLLSARGDRPAGVGDDEVLVRVHAASIHVGDWMLMHAACPTSCAWPPGCAGRRTASRERTSPERSRRSARTSRASAPGDEVFGWCTGAFAEYACATADHFVPKPANLTFEQAAAVGVSATTALQLLRDQGKIQPGQKVLINGASGGVGTFAVQIAKAFGAEVTGVCSTRQRRDGPLHRRRPRHRLHEGGLHAGRAALRLHPRQRRESFAVGRRDVRSRRTGRCCPNGGGHSSGRWIGSMGSDHEGDACRRCSCASRLRPSIKFQNRADLVVLKGTRRSGQGHAGHRRDLRAERHARGPRPCRRRPRPRDGRHRASSTHRPESSRPDEGDRAVPYGSPDVLSLEDIASPPSAMTRCWCAFARRP